MIKKALLITGLLASLLAVGATWAENIGVVDMHQIFQASPQVQKINADLKKQFEPQRQKIVKLGKSLQDNVKKFQKNQAIMSKANAGALRQTIQQEGSDLRSQQAKFQQQLFNAQNQAMAHFMSKVTRVVQEIAKEEKLDIVLPKNSVLYAKGGMDITAEVSAKLK